MALIDKASLLMVPSTYEAGTLYNVLPSGNRAPDSTDQNSGYDQTRADFTFDRGSNAAATRIGSDGLIKKYRENLLLQSNQFDTTWDDSSIITLTSGQEDKDGGTSAWKLAKGAASAFLYQSITTSGVNTFSLYAKADTTNWIMLQVSGIASVRTFYDLSNGVLGSSLSNVINAEIESIGNGWYRCSFTYNGNAGAIRVFPADGNNDTSGTSGSIYIQNAQLETGLVATDYLDSGATTAKAGVLIDLPRINYDANGENGALLLEPSRQQLITQSEYFGSYTPLSVTITDNAATSPEGLVNAASFIETTASGRHRTQTNSFSVTSGSTYTLSIFAKIASGSRLLCLNADYIFNARAYFDLVNGDVEGTDSGSASIEDYGNGWYRCSITGTSSITGSSLAYFGLEDGASDNGYTGDGTSGHYWYGLQAEAGSYATSYIPNHGESGGVTRAADLCTGAGNSDTFNDSEGVLYVELKTDWEDNNGVKGISAQANINNFVSIYFRNDNFMSARVNGNGSVTQLDFTYTTNTYYKAALVYNSTSSKLFVNGVLQDSDTTLALPTGLNELAFDRGSGFVTEMEGYIKQVIYFPEALSDSELATLTTL